MNATINGANRDLPEGMTVAGLLGDMGIDRAGIAVAVNERVVRRTTFDELALHDGDAVEIIRAVAGG